MAAQAYASCDWVCHNDSAKNKFAGVDLKEEINRTFTPNEAAQLSLFGRKNWGLAC
jgi:hypothetical protein